MPVRRPAARLFRFALPILFLLILVARGPVGDALGQTTPARGDAQVIAQGLAGPPAERSAWRVVKQEIPARIDARPSNRMQSSTGFLLADANPVFVADQRTKLRTRLSPGEAQFVATGANQTWASLEDGEGSAYTIELVDRDVARDVTNEEGLVFAGSSFEMLPGDYDLDLIRDDVPEGDRARIDQFDFPVLIFVTSGEVEITSSRSDEEYRIEDGEAVSLRGEIVITTRGEKTATFVAAIVGDALSGGTEAPTAVPIEDEDDKSTNTPKPKRTPTATPEPENDVPGINDGASVRIAVRLCREGMTYFAIDPRGCARADGEFQMALVAEDGTRLRMSDASKAEPSFVRWSGLKAGVYVLVVGKMPEGFQSYSLDGYVCCSSNEGYEIVVGKNQLIDGTMYMFRSPFGFGAPVSTPVPAAQQAPDTVLPGADSDGDGLSDELELDVFGTSPNLVDSDGDTISDGVEAFGSNGWLTAPALPDTDFDGVNDNIEISRGTNPLDANSN